MAVCAWHEPSPACRGRWAGRQRRSGLVGSCSPRPQKILSCNSEEGRQNDRSRGGAVPIAVCNWHAPSPACPGRRAVWHLRSGLVGGSSPPPQNPLPEPSAGQDKRMVGRRQSSTGDTHELRDGPSQPCGGVGGVGAAGRGYLAAVLPRRDTCEELVVDTTVGSFGRNPRGLRALSQTAGVPIMMGCVSRDPPPESLFPIPIPESLIPQP